MMGCVVEMVVEGGRVRSGSGDEGSECGRWGGVSASGRGMIDAGGVEWEGFIIRGCECNYVLKTAATGSIYGKYKSLGKYISQRKLTKLTVPCNNCKWWFG
ncbi:MAG: hypothetical protein U9N12_04230 [Euryarchaeota archaeon]|nr:hypothetical protein [Euryarchaeota archaeon]